VHDAPLYPTTTLDQAEPNPTSSKHTVYSFLPNIAYGLGNQDPIIPNGLAVDKNVAPYITEEATQDVGIVVDPMTAFEAFQNYIADAHRVEGDGRDQLLSEAFQECHPTSDSGVYTTMVVGHLLQHKLDPRAILARQWTSGFMVPSIQSAEGSDFLICLERCMSEYPHCVSDIHQIHKKLAKPASSAAPSASFPDNTLLMLVRQLWYSAHSQGVGTESAILATLLSLSKKFTDQLCRSTLSSIVRDVTRIEHRVLTLIASVAENPELLAVAEHILACIPRERLSGWIPSVTMAYAKRICHKTDDQKRVSLVRMHVWLQILRQLDSKTPQPKELLVDAALAPLGHYAFATRTEVQERMPVLLAALLMTAFRDVSIPQISDWLTMMKPRIKRSVSSTIDDTFGLLMSHLQTKDLPHKTIVQKTIDLSTQYARPETILSILKVIHQRGLNMTDPRPIYTFVTQQLVARKRKVWATEKARQDDASRLHAYQRILDFLLPFDSIPDELVPQLEKLQAERQFQHILDRARENHALPLSYRKMKASASMEQRVGLIHQLAHRYTTDTTRSQREAWRAMYYLYRYLQRYSLPVGRLFSKAVVRISIIRPLSENRFVSARRVIWVCHLVADVEGEEVARKVEAAFWHWRGDLIRHAKTVYVGVGGNFQDKAHIGRMKNLGLI
jgi:hypothetical protein